MSKHLQFIPIAVPLLLASFLSSAATDDSAHLFPDIKNKKIMVGVWQNQTSESAGYQQGTAANIDLSAIAAEYNVITVAFMSGGAIPTFKPWHISDRKFRQQVAALNQQGRAVLISLGGDEAHIALQSGEAPLFAAEIIRLVEHYGFDGLDVSLPASAMARAANQTEIPAALKRVKARYPQFIISMSPAFPDLRSGGSWQIAVNQLEGYYDFISPQYYNHGDDGVDGEGGWYAQNDDSKKAEFIYTLTDSLVRGSRGFIALPADKFVIGLPSNPDAASSGYVKNEADVRRAYEQLAAQGTPIKGLMNWSVNWDNGHSKSGNAWGNQFIERFAKLFNEQLAVALDTEAPGQPGALTLLQEGAQVKLTWQAASDNVAVAHYSIWRNGVEVGKSALPAWVDVAVSAGESYDYQIVAADQAGNVSPAGEIASITLTEEAMAETFLRPGIPQALVVSALAQDRLTLSWAATGGRTRLKSFRIYRNGVLMDESQTNEYHDKALSAATTYEYQVVAVDSENNPSAKSQPLIVKTPEPVPAMTN